MKFPWTCLIVVLFLSMTFNGQAENNPKATYHTTISIDRLSDEVVASRIAQMDLPFHAPANAQIKSVIRRFTVEGRRDSEYILGRAKIYFPIFEHYLQQYDLPQSLKYLPVVESSLRPEVVSPVGAAGLWQFVPSTARLYGLKVNGAVDERLDPHKATKAAAQMLAALYEEFNDWGLVLAAYNCGPGRVRRAMRSAGANDYWSVRPYLPRESQHYVPRFVAAAYLMNYHSAHGIEARLPDYQLLDTRTFRITNALHLSTVARTLGVSYRTLRKLNPSYRQGLISANAAGQYVTVPANVANAFAANYLNTSSLAVPANHLRTSYTTVPGDELATLAQLFQCSEAELIAWNGLQDEQLTVNQTLTVYMPQRVVTP